MVDENDTLAEDEKPGYDSNDPKQVRDRQAVAGRRDSRIKAEYKALLSRPQGRELLWELLSLCGVYHTSYHPGSQNLALEMAFAEGSRNVGLQLQSKLIKADTAMFNKMTQENSNG